LGIEAPRRAHAVALDLAQLQLSQVLQHRTLEFPRKSNWSCTMAGVSNMIPWDSES
jgi:hypothetical protein